MRADSGLPSSETASMMLRDETGHPTSLGMRRAAVAIAACAMLAAAPYAADRPAGTIVTSNMNDNTASVIDAASGRVLATLPTGTGPHEVAISHDGRWA
ncbi:MAG TPA: hypothetical protein VIC24_03010, partial [Gemmatimonadaceae bacterium]